MRTSTQSHHAERISALVAAIEARLDDPPTVRELAEHAAMSPFHFHRVYRALTGETVQETVRRLRIARAVSLLRDEGASVTDVAFAVGYESSQAFAKAFRALTGKTASQAKTDGLDALADKLARPAAVEPACVEVTLVSVEPFKVAAITRAGPPDKLAHGYRALLDRAIALGFGDSLRGVHGVPSDDLYEVPLDVRRYDCCMDFGDHADSMADDEIRVLEIGGGLYASARHVGRYEDIDAVYAGLYAAVVKNGGFEFRDAPIFTTYVDTPNDAPPDRRRVDLHIPLVPLREDTAP